MNANENIVERNLPILSSLSPLVEISVLLAIIATPFNGQTESFGAITRPLIYRRLGSLPNQF